MSKSAWCWGGLASLILGGCQTPLCGELTRAYAGVEQKSRPCLERAPLPSFEETRCERQLDACDPEDQDQLAAQAACYQALGTCAPGAEDAFFQDLTHCDALAPSNACEAALFY